MPTDLPQVAFTNDITREWAKFRRRIRKGPGDIPDCVESWNAPVQLWLTSPQPRCALYFTKFAAFRRYTENWQWYMPPITAFGHSGLPGKRSLASIFRIARFLNCPLFFVGDLDPGDLTIHAALRCGSPDLVRSKQPGLPIRYLGIGGSRFRRLRDRVPKNRWISMDNAERSHFELIQHVYPRLDKMIGSQELGN